MINGRILLIYLWNWDFARYLKRAFTFSTDQYYFIIIICNLYL